MKQLEIDERLNEQRSIVNDRLSKLEHKDYIGTKTATKVATVEEYADDIATMEMWRAELNAAEEEIKRLEAIEPEEEPISDEEAV